MLPFKLWNPMQEPIIWREKRYENQSRPTLPYLTDNEYGRCLEAFPRVCSDILALDPSSKGFYLAKRIHHSARGRWCFGGGQRRGQTPREAAIKNLKRETGILRNPNELMFLFATEMHWNNRNPQPQDVSEQCRVLTYCFVPTTKEIRDIKLDPGEYDLDHGVRLYSRQKIEGIEESTRELLLMYWDAAFEPTK